MKRLVGMTLVLAGVAGGLVLLSAAFYLLAGWLGSVAVGWGLPQTFGTGVASAVTLLLVVTMGSGSLLTVAERKWSAMMQNRIGANRIRVFGAALGGIPFLLADAIKMLTKERMEPALRTRFLFEVGPFMAFAPVFALFAVIPVGPPVSLAGLFSGVRDVALQVVSLDVGVLYLFALGSLQVYGTSLAGWASNNKLALLGGVRATSQMISYEVSLGLSLVGTMMAYRTLRLEEMVAMQGTAALGPVPALGILIQPVGFLIFFASAFAETKRAPFDLPEGESEIVGYFVEYSGMKFGLMFLAEFVEIVVLSGVVTAVFLGGWQPVVVPFSTLVSAVGPLWAGAVGAAIFIAKMIVVMWLQLTIRWLLPRFRFDQIQKLCWKILLPAALANVFVTGAALLLDPTPGRLTLLTAIGILTLIAIAIVTIATGRAPKAEAHAHGGDGHGDAHGAAHASGH
ncbi:MAG TPA: complex I subunit 1 family protein [Anaeromyxobacteraceae bacterium]|nr:complex I subunit 1 family protein [Anaeromyxobacteraceae bacterium]